MDITLRLHPSLRRRLRKAAGSSHHYREMLARLAAEATATVARHGAAITHAPLNPLGAPLDEAGCAMSAFARGAGAVVDVDPLGTARGEAVVLWQPRGPVRASRVFRANGAVQKRLPPGTRLTLPSRRGRGCGADEEE